MPVSVTRANVRLDPDYKKVFPRFFNTGRYSFEQGLLDENALVHVEPSGRFISEGQVTQQKLDNKKAFVENHYHK
ncbi:MAG: hypothetical protein ACR2KZ_06305 [Segetibacter sp.]